MEDPEVREAFQRELYRHSDPVPPGDHPTEGQSVPVGGGRLRRRLEQIAHELQRDASQAVPWTDPSLMSSRGLRGRYKLAIHRLIRPVSRRYDRITADLARACLDLTDLVIRSQDEARQLRQQVAALEERIGRLGADGEMASTDPAQQDG
jgi:hypothetical protein